MTKTHLMKNYLLKMTQSLHITKIYRVWQPNLSNHYNLKQCNDFRILSIPTVYTGSAYFFFGPKNRHALPNQTKQQICLNSFKKNQLKNRSRNIAHVR